MKRIQREVSRNLLQIDCLSVNLLLPSRFAAEGDGKMLTKQQRSYFETFGFLVFKGLYTAEEIEVIRAEADSILDEDRDGRPFDGAGRQAVLRFVERRPFLSTMPTDDRIFCAIEDLLGSGFYWIGGDGNLYVGDTHWHSDSTGEDHEFGFDRIKVALYLDPVGRDTGCLRVIPGSHHIGLHQLLEPLRHLRIAQRDVGGKPMSREEQREAGITSDFDDTPFGVESPELPHFALESEPGDVVFFNHRLWHSSFGGKVGRRMFTMNFAEVPRTEQQLSIARETYQSILDVLKLNGRDNESAYSKAFHESDDPRVQRMMAVPEALGFR